MWVLTIGTFDLYHDGHDRLLERAAWFGPVTVGVNSDRFVHRYKGRAAKQRQHERLARIRENPLVTKAALNDGPGIDLIREFKPDLLVIGSDWLDKDYTAQLGTCEEELTALGVAVLFLPRTPGVSTTELREAA